MIPQQIEEILLDTCSDARLSRTQGEAIKALFRKRAFEIAHHEMMTGGQPTDLVMKWLEDVTKRVYSPAPKGSEPEAYARFSPGNDCLRTIVSLIGNCRSTADICVFTITDDRITRELQEAVGRGVKVRVVTDNDKSEDLESDIDHLERSGVPVRMDRTQAHMHHKFALFDCKALLTGSYNWTRSAERYNQENIVVSNEKRLVRPN